MLNSPANAPVITIDGPGGSGKGTIAQKVAKSISWHLLDSGALYRLVALAAANHGVSLDNEESLQILAENMDVQFLVDDPDQPMRIVLEGDVVTKDIRSEEVGRDASKVATLPSVRAGLLQRQHDFREAPGLVADGRDMGTVVFPDAELKIFLTASAEERAQRRFKQLQDKGMSANLADLQAAIQSRDEQDMNRAVAPLVPADDSIVIDSTDMTIDEVFTELMNHARNKGLVK
ncbi:MAG: cytidylate kinase [Pseudomonadales bacterium]|jgi:CMP/dCMP kinase|uniref:(d)CMP kinase n=1 Tax=unclassified Ketobacter TaxID=2639109 RepID=UPI000C446C5F|nr:MULTISPECIES: (d)CMP kinase [unclassified Ketobacter]MAA59092.1 cytidylate kinase [Pseudomonadales bacterium]MEC8810620.1 (d)CMP kinase [Pseudomonadota bacterium]TNC88829.1 MAG: cytidylate kinase [Alcanivorax sp.]HAG96307.1 (d)CMP kinase [Gammaproteobacteria bacterium]MAQ24917.1 cytidylate kinase [Pseudomonadales bacterium]|tara:strand:- start:1194 stop:1892 length:699 start_codon:yes stop_codon:yes gene_type:complete